MKRLALAVATAGWLLYASSLFLPWYEFFGVFSGWAVMREVMLAFNAQVTTLTTSLTPLPLWSRRRWPRTLVPWLMLTATVLNL